MIEFKDTTLLQERIPSEEKKSEKDVTTEFPLVDGEYPELSKYPRCPENPDKDWPPRDGSRQLCDKLDDIFMSMGLLAEASSSEDTESSDDADATENPYPDRLEKDKDGKYRDTETGKVYDSVEAWEKAQETLAKRYDGTAKHYEDKAKKEWARFKNAEKNGESDAEKWEHYRRSQEYYAKAKECKEKADKIWNTLGKQRDSTEERKNISEIVPRDRAACVSDNLSDAPDGIKDAAADVADSLAVIDGRPGETCHYNPATRTIYMNPEYDDEQYAEVFGHELGHAVDDHLGDVSSDPQFVDAMELDAEKFEGIDGEELKSEMLDELASTDAIFDRAVSDILSGMFLNDEDIMDRYDEEGVSYYMHSNEYWTNGPKNAIGKELFANMFRIYSDPSRTDSVAFVEKYFPNASAQFKRELSI